VKKGKVLKWNDLDFQRTFELREPGGVSINALPLDDCLPPDQTLARFDWLTTLQKRCDASAWTGLQKHEAAEADGECLEIPRCQLYSTELQASINPRISGARDGANTLSRWHVILRQQHFGSVMNRSCY
jgi:hypothetical protein